jgi:WD40 repeat protein
MEEEEAPTPKPIFKKTSGREEKDKEEEEKIIETKEYVILKDNKTHKFSVNKTNQSIIIRSFNYESRLVKEDLIKITKLFFDTLDDGFKFITDIFDNKKVLIKEVELNKRILIQIKIYDFSGKERLIEIEMLYNTNNKDFIINELTLKCSSLEGEIINLKTEMKNMKNEILNSVKNDMDNLKSLIKDIKEEKTKEKEVKHEEKKEKKEEKSIFFSQKTPNALDNSGTSKMMTQNINLIGELIKDSYSDWGVDHVFTAFTSVNKNAYLIYSTKEKKAKCINLNNIEEEKNIKIKHDKYITNIHHYYEEKKNRDIVMTVSAENNNIKLWDFNDFKQIIDIKNINNKSLLLSACFIRYNNNDYIATSNGDLENKSFDPIKLYTFEGKQSSIIKDSNINTIFINSFYDKEKDLCYIITGNDGLVRSYDLKENRVFTFEDKPYSNFYRSVAVIFSNTSKKIISSSEEGNIRIWDFDTLKLINKIYTGCNPLRGICIYDEDIAFIGSKDETIKVVDIKNGVIINSLRGHSNTVLTIKKINLEKFGNCLISQGMSDETIKLWKIN